MNRSGPLPLKAPARLLLIIVGVFFAQVPVATMAATYYIDSVAGSENNNGTSSATPWRSITPTSKVNTTVFQPGDNVLFKRGSSWTGTITPKGNGTSVAPVTWSNYGAPADPLPVINGAGAENTFLLWNPRYITIRDFEITNWSSSNGWRDGIRVNYIANGTFTGLKILDNRIHSVRGTSYRGENGDLYQNAAIYIKVIPSGSARSKADDILIEGNEIYDITCIGLYVMHATYMNGHPEWWITNLVVRDNVFDKTGADLIVLNGTDAPLVEYNAGYDAGINGSNYKFIAGMWPCYWTRNTLFQFNEVARTRKDAQFYNGFDGDSQAFDVDYGTMGTHIFQYNYTHDNEGGVLLVMPADKTGMVNYVKTVIFRYNLSVNDGRNNLGSSQFVLSPVPGISSVHVYNNVFYSTLAEGFRFSDNSASYYTNNIFHGPAGIYPSKPWFSHNAYYGHTPNVTDPYKVVANPQFVGPLPTGPGADGFLLANTTPFRLQSGSPLINRGKPITAPLSNGGRDFWGNPLYAGTHADIGAHEVVGGTGSPPAPVTIIDNPPGASVTYGTNTGTAEWSHSTDAIYYNGTKSVSARVGDWCQVAFTGTHMSLYGRMGPGLGRLAVSIDGGAPTIVNCYWPVDLHRVELHRATGLANAPHTIRYTIQTKSSYSTWNSIGIDYFQATPSAPPALPEITLIDNPSGTYTGTWAHTTTDANSYALTRSASSTIDSYVQFSFTGTGVRFYGPKGADYGRASISINGGAATLVDCFSPVLSTKMDHQIKLYEVNGLPHGTHTIRITVATKSAQATGNKVSIDFLQALVGGAAPLAVDNPPGAGVAYSGTWTHSADPGYYNGTKSVSNIVGNYAQSTFTGTGVSLFAKKDNGLGRLNISIDGGPAQLVDCYVSTGPAFQQNVFEITGLSPGAHTIRATIATKNPASSGNYIGLDHIIVHGSGTGEVDNPPGPGLAYSGTWTHTADASYYNGTKSVSNVVGDYVQHTFTGTGIALFAKKDAGLGRLNISIDGGPAQLVDCYVSTGPAFQQNVFEVTGLSPGAHTIRATIAPKNPASNGNYIGIDYFRYQQ